MKFKKKPVVIEAIQATGTPDSNREIIDWARGSKTPAFMDKRTVTSYGGTGVAPVEIEERVLKISTLEGDHIVSPGDWVIKGVAGEFYPCKPDIFAATYEPAE